MGWCQMISYILMILGKIRCSKYSSFFIQGLYTHVALMAPLSMSRAGSVYGVIGSAGSWAFVLNMHQVHCHEALGLNPQLRSASSKKIILFLPSFYSLCLFLQFDQILPQFHCQTFPARVLLRRVRPGQRVVLASRYPEQHQGRRGDALQLRGSALESQVTFFDNNSLTRLERTIVQSLLAGAEQL